MASRITCCLTQGKSVSAYRTEQTPVHRLCPYWIQHFPPSGLQGQHCHCPALYQSLCLALKHKNIAVSRVSSFLYVSLGAHSSWKTLCATPLHLFSVTAERKVLHCKELSTHNHVICTCKSLLVTPTCRSFSLTHVLGAYLWNRSPLVQPLLMIMIAGLSMALVNLCTARYLPCSKDTGHRCWERATATIAEEVTQNQTCVFKSN